MTKISQIIDHLKYSEVSFEYKGDEELELKSYASLDKVNEQTIYWIKNKEKLDEITLTEFRNLNVLIVSPYLKAGNLPGINFIHCENPKEVYFSILTEFFLKQRYLETSIGKSVVETASIGERVSIGHNCYIGSEVVINEDVEIKNNVTIEGKVEIGKGTIISSGVVIGSDGYGYFQNSKGINIKVPHFGGVLIGEDVEIGANTCIDKGTLSDTIIGDNVKIDNLCHIAHNVVIESNVSVIALSMIAGSVTLKENSYIAPSASIMNQLTIGENSIVGLGAVVVKDVEANLVVAGVPAKTIRKINIE